MLNLVFFLIYNCVLFLILEFCFRVLKPRIIIMTSCLLAVALFLVIGHFTQLFDLAKYQLHYVDFLLFLSVLNFSGLFIFFIHLNRQKKEQQKIIFDFDTEFSEIFRQVEQEKIVIQNYALYLQNESELEMLFANDRTFVPFKLDLANEKLPTDGNFYCYDCLPLLPEKKFEDIPLEENHSTENETIEKDEKKEKKHSFRKKKNILPQKTEKTFSTDFALQDGKEHVLACWLKPLPGYQFLFLAEISLAQKDRNFEQDLFLNDLNFKLNYWLLTHYLHDLILLAEEKKVYKKKWLNNAAQLYAQKMPQLTDAKLGVIRFFKGNKRAYSDLLPLKSGFAGCIAEVSDSHSWYLENYSLLKNIFRSGLLSYSDCLAQASLFSKNLQLENFIYFYYEQNSKKLSWVFKGEYDLIFLPPTAEPLKYFKCAGSKLDLPLSEVCDQPGYLILSNFCWSRLKNRNGDPLGKDNLKAFILANQNADAQTLESALRVKLQKFGSNYLEKELNVLIFSFGL